MYRNRLLLSAVLLFAPLAVRAATLRPYVSLTGEEVLLSDLFSGLAPGQDQPIGPAPSPGNRIEVPAGQLVAIATQFGVDWQSKSPADHVVLESPGVPVATSLITDALAAPLNPGGVPADQSITLTGYTPVLVAPGDHVNVVVGALQYQGETGDFTAELTLSGATTPAVSLRVSGNVAELASVPVLTHLIPAHQQITADDVTMAKLRLPRQGADAIARDPKMVIGQALDHVASPGAPILLADLGAPEVVAANALVEMDLNSGGLSLAGRAIAEQGGAVGDTIRVRNPSSLAVMMAKITGPDEVEVDAESQPIFIAHSEELAAR